MMVGLRQGWDGYFGDNAMEYHRFVPPSKCLIVLSSVLSDTTTVVVDRATTTMRVDTGPLCIRCDIFGNLLYDGFVSFPIPITTAPAKIHY
jgi:hypothetical protein